MSLATVKEFFSLLAIAVPLLITTFTFIAKASGNKKLQKIAERINFFKEQATKYITLAEQIVNFRGADKKEWVLTRINQSCIEAGIPFDHDMASDIIEGIIALSKSVNKREKDSLLTPPADEGKPL